MILCTSFSKSEQLIILYCIQKLQYYNNKKQRLCLTSEYTCERPVLPNVKTLVKNLKEAYVLGEQITLLCRSNYAINEDNSAICQSDGSWGERLPACYEGKYIKGEWLKG